MKINLKKHAKSLVHKIKGFNFKNLWIKIKSFRLSDLKKIKKWQATLAVLVVVAIVGGIVAGVRSNNAKEAMTITVIDTTVERMDITSSITGSAVVNPKDQYSITALVSGDVISANFEQGDVVAEGDILYEIDSSDAQTSIENADISYQRSQMDYNKAAENYANLTVKSTIAGTVKTLYVKRGDSVSAGTKIADIYDDSSLTLTVTFNDADAAHISRGNNATVRVSSNGEILYGTVTDVNSSGYAAAGNTLVRKVKISVKNPGVLMNTETATAEVNGFACNAAGTFEYNAERTITAQSSGEIDAIYVSEGSKVSSGTKLVHIDSDTVEDNLTSSSLSLRSSALSRDNARDKLDDYTITAPISGTVVMKNIKAGDKLDNSNMSTEMAVIYDMSSLECELAVDELDIKNVEVGQSVTITSDAVEGRIYHGEVSNVSINGTTSGGVTTYPVTIVITDFDEDLLPGMNIDVEITTSQATNVIAVPVAAVNRGNIVYVKGEKTDENDSAPEGYKSVRVQTGVYNNDYIEIVSGINEGDVADVLTQSQLSNKVYGFLIAAGTKETSVSGTSVTKPYVKVILPDGESYEYITNKDYSSILNRAVSVTLKDGTTTVSAITAKSDVSGKFTWTSGTKKLGSTPIASDVEIIEVSTTASYETATAATVFPQRLNGITLPVSDILYSSTNSDGEVDALILTDKTGDMHTYGIITSAKSSNTSTSVSGSYEYIVNGSTNLISTNNKAYNVSTGQAVKIVSADGRSVTSIQALNKAASGRISDVSGSTITISGKSYTMSDTVDIYVKKSYEYTMITIDELESMASEYSAAIYQDKAQSAGGRVRIIVLS